MRQVKVAKRYGSGMIEHTVTEHDGETEIKIEMPLEPFVADIVDQVITVAVERVLNPATLLTRSRIESALRRDLAQIVDAAIAESVARMKESTVYKAAEKF